MVVGSSIIVSAMSQIKQRTVRSNVGSKGSNVGSKGSNVAFPSQLDELKACR